MSTDRRSLGRSVPPLELHLKPLDESNDSDRSSLEEKRERSDREARDHEDVRPDGGVSAPFLCRRWWRNLDTRPCHPMTRTGSPSLGAWASACSSSSRGTAVPTAGGSVRRTSRRRWVSRAGPARQVGVPTECVWSNILTASREGVVESPLSAGRGGPPARGMWAACGPPRGICTWSTVAAGGTEGGRGAVAPLAGAVRAPDLRA